MVAPTVSQMAEAYAENVRQEIVRAKQELVSQQQTILALEAHLGECMEAIQQSSGPPNFKVPSHQARRLDDTNSSEVTEIQLPNPFDQIKNMTSNKEEARV